MKDKTAMQTLIDELDKLSSNNSGKAFNEGIQWAKFKAERLIEKEKQQIIDAAKKGFEYPMVLNGSDIKAEDYFNEKYNNE